MNVMKFWMMVAVIAAMAAGLILVVAALSAYTCMGLLSFLFA